MTDDLRSTRAELTSVASTLAELTERVTSAAEAVARGDEDDVSHDLFDVERSLRAAGRRLETAIRQLA